MERKELKNSNTWSRVSNSVSSVRLISLSRYIFSKMLKQESCWHRSSLYRVASILMIIQNLILLDRFFSELKCQDNPGQAFQAPASGLSRCSKYRANGRVLQGGQSLRVVDGSLVTQLIVP